jgi:hypothetical protein
MSKEWKNYDNFVQKSYSWKFQRKKSLKKLFQKCFQSKIFANNLFLGKQLGTALLFYILSLSIAKLQKNKNRILCFSNRAQCWILLKKELNSIVDCSIANKLSLYHQKTWYRKIFVVNKKKDYLWVFLSLIKISILAQNFFKKISLIKIDFYSNNILRLENFLTKIYYWKTNDQKKKSKMAVFIKNKNILNFFLSFYFYVKSFFKTIIIYSSLLSFHNFFIFIENIFIYVFFIFLKNFNSLEKENQNLLIFISTFYSIKTFYLSNENITFFKHIKLNKVLKKKINLK